ncbi:L-aspartate oxidase [Thiohalorhabdus methylotrophus]|uniref:L-aspartate oxidase n=1 Tax=Thiohalorhabdus methylotrophus TaxID=3242694 RepID=A0ABV4TWW5_9GAMM
MIAQPPNSDYSDTLIIGAGISGLSAALALASDHQVTLLTKGRAGESATLYAQGGIAAVLDPADSFEEHVHDTLEAGAGLCHPETVDFVVRHGPGAIQRLIAMGVPFTREAGEEGPLSGFHLTREGGHSHRRIIHAADATGRAVETTLLEAARAHPNIRLLDQHVAIQLITAAKVAGKAPERDRCWGAYALHAPSGQVTGFGARTTLLATGGAGKVYLYTTNPDTATGDGIAMAYRAGCRVANMEFIQFHPTCLYHPEAKSFLISEAVRGEGGILRLANGDRFMPRHDERAELAPRDIVARAIDYEMKRTGADCVYLDITHQPQEFLEHHFPTIRAKCLEYGIDIATEPIPVVPAAHYTCGGIVTNLQGHTDLDGLFAVGETAHTGLHGANRLASNSLLEGLVLADSAQQAMRERTAQDAGEMPDIPGWDTSRVTESNELVVVAHDWAELRQFMWDYMGIVRTDKRLERAKRRLDMLLGEVEEYYARFTVTQDLIELRHLALVADLIIRSARSRRESRGLHYNQDYPGPETGRPPWDTVVYRTPDGHGRTEDLPIAGGSHGGKSEKTPNHQDAEDD